MSMKNITVFRAMNNVDDKYILEALPKKTKYYDIPKRRMKSKWITGSAAAILLGCVIFNVSNPVLAKEIPVLGKIFAYVQDKIDFPGTYSEYAEDVGVGVKDNGITITISEIYCDGSNLFVSYTITSEKEFESYADEESLRRQMSYISTDYIETSNGKEYLEMYGAEGMEGEFLDSHTFVGVETYSLKEDKFPEIFSLKIQMESICFLESDIDDIDVLNGEWNFSIPVTVNDDNVETLEINEMNENHSIDKIFVSPVMIKVYTSYPNIYSGTVRYEVAVYGDKSEGDIGIQGEYGATSGITQMPRNSTDKLLDVYVYDNSKIKLDYSKIKGSIEEEIRKQIEENAIVYKRIILQ